MKLRHSWLAAWMCLAAACSAGPTPKVVVNNQVNVSISGGPSAGSMPPTIDAADPRIGVAQSEIEKLLGRQLKFEVDRTLIPAFGQGLHAAFVAALESTVTQLRYCQKNEASAFDYAVTHLRTVRWMYTATKRPEAPTFDTESGLVTVLVPPDQWELMKDYTLVETFSVALKRDHEARYSGLGADKVNPAEYSAYFAFQRSYQRPKPDATGRIPSSDELGLRKLDNVLTLHDRLPPGPLKDDVREWLVSSGSGLRRELIDKDSEPEAKALAQVVQPRWMHWLNQNHSSFSARESKEIADLMFNRHYAPLEPFRRGFHAVAFATPHIRAWVKTQAIAANERKSDPLQELVVCPYVRYRAEEHFSGSSYCNGALYTDVFKQPSGAKKLAQFLLKEKAEALIHSATLHVNSKLGVESAVSLLEELSSDESASKAALVALARFGDWGASRSRSSDEPVLNPDPLFKLIPTWWKAYPKRRPELLFLLTQLGKRYEGVVAWPKLPSYLGARISADELSAFLDLDPGTIWSLRNLAKSLSEGWGRSELLIPKLEGWLNAHNKSGGRGPEPHYITERVIETLCVAGTTRDVKALQTFLRERLESFPSENRNLGSFAEKKVSELCPKLDSDEPKKRERPELFGD